MYELDLIQGVIQIVLSVFALIMTAVMSFWFIRRERRRETDKGSKLDLYESEIVQARQNISEPPAGEDINQKLYLILREYHAQGLAQSKISFWFSLIFASLGFLVIVSALLTANQQVSLTQQGQAVLSLIAGTIIDAVAGLFFVQSNRARRLMAEFFDRLRVDRKLEESLRLTGQINDDQLKSRLQALLALHFAELESTDGLLGTLLNSSQIKSTGIAQERILDTGSTTHTEGS